MSWHHGDWLAFAQAAAAVVAIIGAFGVVFFQHNLEVLRAEAKERQESARLIGMAASFVHETLEFLEKMATEKADPLRTETGAHRAAYSMKLHQHMEALNGIPIAGLATSSAAQRLIAARGLLNEAIHKASRDPTAGQANDHFSCIPAYGAPYAPVTRGLRAIAIALDEELKQFADVRYRCFTRRSWEALRRCGRPRGKISPGN
ncbi:hypothetical protein PQR64_23385 [Paraburkholderia phytofirmans]|uniref:hypothetical protein n=1 Tax=Paraburkholderia phytofirmans TaxID=261302 RepID=UPI0038BD95E8